MRIGRRQGNGDGCFAGSELRTVGDCVDSFGRHALDGVGLWWGQRHDNCGYWTFFKLCCGRLSNWKGKWGLVFGGGDRGRIYWGGGFAFGPVSSFKGHWSFAGDVGRSYLGINSWGGWDGRKNPYGWQGGCQRDWGFPEFSPPNRHLLRGEGTLGYPR